MKSSTRLVLICFLFLFFSIQFYLTIFGGFLWPFTSHRLFSQLASPQKSIISAVVEDADGHIAMVHPGRVVPIEYSRCSGLIRHIFGKGTDVQKTQLQNYLLYRLNEKPWWAFDEMFSSIKSPTGAPFTNLSFEIHLIEFNENKQYPDSLQLKQRSPFYP